MFEHTPKTCGLIFKHVWSLYSKLQTCLLAYFKILFCGCNTTYMIPTILPFCPCHIPFGFPTFLCKPWCQGFPPLVWVLWGCYFYFLDHPSLNRFLQDKFFYYYCPFLIATGVVGHKSGELSDKIRRPCIFRPFLCRCGIIVDV